MTQLLTLYPLWRKLISASIGEVENLHQPIHHFLRAKPRDIWVPPLDAMTPLLPPFWLETMASDLSVK